MSVLQVNTGLPTKDEISETTVWNLKCGFLVYMIPATVTLTHCQLTLCQLRVCQSTKLSSGKLSTGRLSTSKLSPGKVYLAKWLPGNFVT